MKINISYKDIWKVTYPIILGSVANNVIHITDTLFVSRLGDAELGGVGISGIFFMLNIFLCLGLGTGAQIIIARRAGERKYQEVGSVLKHVFVLLIVLSISLVLLMQVFGRSIFSFLIQSPHVVEAGFIYLQYVSPGLIFIACNIVFRAFYIGLGTPIVMTISSVIMTVVNVIFNYLLIFGKGGFPEMGVAGAALASVLGEITQFVFLLIYFWVRTNREKYDISWKHILRLDRFKRIIALSYSIIFFYLFAFGGWLVMFLLIEKMGERPLAISNIVRSLYGIFNIIAVGFAFSSNTLVSNILGQGRAKEIMQLVRKTVILSLGVTSVLILVGVVFSDQILSFFSDDPMLIKDAKPSLYVALLASWLFSLATVFFNSLSGTGDTRSAMVIEAISVILSTVFACICVFVLEAPLALVWVSEVLYWIVLFALSRHRLRSNKWLNIEV